MKKINLTILISSSLFTFLLLACKKVNVDTINNLNNGKINIYGHAGSGFQSLLNPYPSNSFISIKQAINGFNADGAEIDIEITSDSIPVIYHDVTLEQNTNCIGCINTKPASEVLNCQYYNNFGAQILKDERIIALDDLLHYFSNYKKLPFLLLNTKVSSRCTNMDTDEYQHLWAKIISNTLTKNQAHSWTGILTPDSSLIKTVLATDPKINILLESENFKEGLHTCKNLGIETLMVSYQIVSKEQVQEAHDAGIKVVVWNVYKRSQAIDAVELQPDAILTENIPLVQEVLR